jgi:hydroxymethylbilane synthase
MLHELVVGTRGSDLALVQTKLASETIARAWPDIHLQRRIIRTSADEGAPIPKEVGPGGRKGLFTAEIERALLAGEIDLAVHSAKDLPSELAPGTEIAAVLPRVDAGDVLVTWEPSSLRELPPKALVATGSVRRKHQLQWQRPDLTLTDLRGNVPTRLRKLHENQWAGVVLAVAGLARLMGDLPNEMVAYDGRDYFLSRLPMEVFLPAAGQGIIALQIRAGDQAIRDVIKAGDDSQTHLCLRAEREFLRLLQADCNCPIGVFACMEDQKLKMRAQIFARAGLAPLEGLVEGLSAPEEAAAELFRRTHGR